MVRLIFNPKTRSLNISCSQLACMPGESDQTIIFRNYILSNLRRKIAKMKSTDEVLDALKLMRENQFKTVNTFTSDGNLIVDFEMEIE